MVDDEDLVDKELKQMKRQRRRREDIEEGADEEEESSVDSLMAESPGKY